MRFPAAMLRHKALGFPWHVPAFGEEVGMWRSHDKKQANSAHNKGAVGRWIAIDPWGNGTSILIAKGTDFQDPKLVHGLQPKTVAVECLRLSRPRITPDGWSKEAVKDLSTKWQTIKTPEGKDLWLCMDSGQTQYSSPFVTEVKGEAAEPAQEPIAY